VRELVTFAAVAVCVGAANLVASGGVAAADLGGVRDRDMGDSAPAPIHLTNWTGFYIGAGVGGAMFSASDAEAYIITPAPVTPSAQTIDFGSQGFLGTVQAGYDFQFPLSRWVAGVFVDYDWVSAEAERVLNPGAPSLRRKISLDDEWSVGGRLGYLFSPDTLVYGLAAYTSQSTTVTGVFSQDPNHQFTQSMDGGGWSLGGGVETHLQDNLSLKFEYRFTQSDQGNIPFVAPGYNGNISESLDTQTARLMLTYKFSRW
jgi:outer membrane immunogenic protein